MPSTHLKQALRLNRTVGFSLATFEVLMLVSLQATVAAGNSRFWNIASQISRDIARASPSPKRALSCAVKFALACPYCIENQESLLR